MTKIRKKDIKRFRAALLKFADEIWRHRIDVGGFDKDIERFLNGKKLEITLSIQLIPHDLIIFREMLGIEMDDETRKKIWNLEELTQVKK